MKHCNSHGDSYAYVEVEFVGPGSTLTPSPSLPQVSTYGLTCTMDFFSLKSMGRGLYMDPRKAGGGKDNVRWHNICLYFGLFWAPWKGGYQSIFLWEILWVFEHKWGLFPLPSPQLGCVRLYGTPRAARQQWDSCMPVESKLVATGRPLPSYWDMVNLAAYSNNQQKQSYKPSRVSRSSWEHLCLSPSDRFSKILRNSRRGQRILRRGQKELALRRRG